MARISEQTIEHIRSRADIVDVVSSYVQLKRRGKNYFGLCPFHGEKTASFSVNEAKQIYHCFGCGAGGGSINFVMEIEKMNFIEAVQYLADKYGIPIDTGGSRGPKELFTQLVDIQEFALQYFIKNLQTGSGLKVAQYLSNRGLSQKTIADFQLGFSSEGWTTLLDLMRKEKFSGEAMKGCGLFISSEKGFFDRFRNRVMFPIKNTRGKIAGFAGRIFQSDDPAKYVNSPETPIYNKSSILYGLWKTKEAIRKSDKCIVVEGYLDFLQLYQAGITNIIAVSGTAFTDNHARELRKFTNNITLAYDGDKAGVSAAIRAGYVLLRNNLTPAVTLIPKDIDPDDWVKEKGPKPFLQAVDSAEALLQFQFRQSEDQLKKPTEKANFISNILLELAQIPDGVIREIYLKELSDISGVNENTLFGSLDSIIQRQRQRQPMKQQSGSEKTGRSKIDGKKHRLETEILQLCFSEDDKIRELLYNKVDVNWFDSSQNRRIFEQTYIHLHSEFPPNVSTILDGLDEAEDRKKLSALIYTLEDSSPTVNWAIDCLIRIEKRFLSTQLEEKRKLLQDKTAPISVIKKVISECAQIEKDMKIVEQKYVGCL